MKCGIMEEILEAKSNSCSEFKQALKNSLGKHLVEAVKSDIFWSSGLNPQEALSTKPHYYPGQNRLGYLLERVRSNLLLRHPTKTNNGHINVRVEEMKQLSITQSDLLISVPMLSVSTTSLDKPVIQSASQTVFPHCSSELNLPSATSSKQNENHSCSIESIVPSTTSSIHEISESSDPISSSTVSLNVPSLPLPSRLNTDDTSLTHNTPVSHKGKPSGSTFTKVQKRDHIVRKHKSSSKASDLSRKLYMNKLDQENKNKGDLMSWVKRKLSPEKEADTSLIAKQSRSDSITK